MATDQFDDLLKLMPKIAEAVNVFKSEAVQQDAYRTLIDALFGHKGQKGSHESGSKTRGSVDALGRKRQRGAKRETNGEPDIDGLDLNDLVNTMKERKEFRTISDEVLHKRDLWNKIRVILFYADTAMTSGELQKVLSAFDLKTDRPGVSNKLKREHSRLVSSGARKPGAVIRYKLSGPAKRVTEKWLNELIK